MKKLQKYLSRTGKILLSLLIAATALFGMNVPQVQATQYNTSTAESNKQIIFNYLTGTAGYNCAVACGIMANIQNESGFLANNVGDAWEYANNYTDESFTQAIDNGTISRSAFMNNGTGYGLCQWTYYSVKGELYDYAKSRGTSIGDITTQLMFLVSTLKSYNLEKYMTSCPNTSEGAFQAGYNFCYYYEQPNNKVSSSNTRGAIARDTYWPSYSTKTVSTASSTTDSSATAETPTVDTAETTSAPTVDTAESTSGTSTDTSADTTAASTATAASTDTASADSSYTTGSWTLNDTMTVRSSADTSSSAVGYLKKGTKVDVTAVSGRFGQISYNGQTAWVSLKYASKNSSESSSDYSTGSWTVSTAMTVRSSADTTSSAVGYLKEGTTVNVTAVSGRFGQISYNGQTAWVSLKYATKTGEATASSTASASTTSSTPSTGSWRLDSVMTIRSDADTSSSSLGTIDEGATIIVTEVKGDFGKFDYKGQTAWISLKYATKIG